MKKLYIIIPILLITSFFVFSKKGKIIKNTALTFVTSPYYINKDGLTIKDRTILPKGYKRAIYESQSFSDYIQNYNLKPYGAQVINYNGDPYVY